MDVIAAGLRTSRLWFHGSLLAATNTDGGYHRGHKEHRGRWAPALRLLRQLLRGAEESHASL